ncbi:hypothetical protein I4U23_015532 [Adineta vaga]|nr:hypothetical protein I4U23_015532 [Adineta vaga]
MAESINTTFNPSTQTLVFNSQIRTAPISTTSNTVTVIRGLAAKSNHPDAQSMSITISRRNMIIVRRGNETLDLDVTNDNTISSNTSLVLVFPEMILEKNRTNNALTLSWSVGISIQITPVSISNGLILNLGISVSNNHQNRTFGLLGLFDNNAANDLRSQNGVIVGEASALTMEQIHRQFGQTWAINPSRSLFYYETGDSAVFYTNQNLQFTPSFTSPEPQASQVSTALAACGIDSSTDRSTWTVAQQTCYYDIAVTNDISLGQTSRLVADTIAQAEEDQRYPPEFNSALPLILTVQASTPVTINFTAVSPYTTNIIYTLVQGPSSAIFNSETAIFYWSSANVTENLNTVVRVSAQDTLYNLVSTHELVIHVISSIPTTSFGNILSISWMIIFINFIGTFYLL